MVARKTLQNVRKKTKKKKQKKKTAATEAAVHGCYTV